MILSFKFISNIYVFVSFNSVGTPPPDATWHAFSFGLAPSGSPPKETRGALLLSGLPQGETHDTRKHYIRTTDIPYPNIFVRIVD